MAFYKGLAELGVPLNYILSLEEINGIGPDGDVSFVSNNVQTLGNAIRGQPTAADDPLTPPVKPNGSGRSLPN
jgi:hypothetical protein